MPVAAYEPISAPFESLPPGVTVPSERLLEVPKASPKEGMAPQDSDMPGRRQTPRRLPAPTVPDELVDPFEDETTWVPGKNRNIKKSAYWE